MMQGGRTLAYAKAIMLVMLFFCSICSLSVNKTLGSTDTENNHVQFSDNNSNIHQWNIEAGQWYSIEVFCETCTAELKLDEATLFEESFYFDTLVFYWHSLEKRLTLFMYLYILKLNNYI